MHDEKQHFSLSSLTETAFNAEGNVFHFKNQEIFNNLAQPKTYKKGQIIYNQGDDANFVYYLVSGKVQIYVSSPSGTEKILATFSGGSMFGKSAFFDKLPRASCAKTLAKSEIIPIDRAKMADIISNYPHFALEMLEYLSNTIRMFSNQIENISFLQADKRIAMFIISKIPKESVKEANSSFFHQSICAFRKEGFARLKGMESNMKIKCTHDEISITVGVSRVTVSRVLSRFVNEGLITTGYGFIKINNAAKLKDFAASTNDKITLH